MFCDIHHLYDDTKEASLLKKTIIATSYAYFNVPAMSR